MYMIHDKKSSKYRLVKINIQNFSSFLKLFASRAVIYYLNGIWSRQLKYNCN